MDQGTQPPRACAACGYNMVGLPDAPACPECGSDLHVTIAHPLLLTNPRRTLIGAKIVKTSYALLFMSYLSVAFSAYILWDVVIYLEERWAFTQSPVFQNVLDFVIYIPDYGLYIGLILWITGWLIMTSGKGEPKSNRAASNWMPGLPAFVLSAGTLGLASSIYNLVPSLVYGGPLLITLFFYSKLSTRYLIIIARSTYPPAAISSVKRCSVANLIFIGIATVCFGVLVVAAAHPNPAFTDGIMYHVGPPLTAYDIAASRAYDVLTLLSVVIIAINWHALHRIGVTLKFLTQYISSREQVNNEDE